MLVYLDDLGYQNQIEQNGFAAFTKYKSVEVEENR